MYSHTLVPTGGFALSGKTVKHAIGLAKKRWHALWQLMSRASFSATDRKEVTSHQPNTAATVQTTCLLAAVASGHCV